MRMVAGTLTLFWFAGWSGGAPAAPASNTNLEACLGGLSASCNRTLLTAAELRRVERADEMRNEVACRFNYSTCRPEQLAKPLEPLQIDSGTYSANYSGCRYSSGPCRVELLTAEHREQIEQLFADSNLAACEQGQPSCQAYKLSPSHRLYRPDEAGRPATFLTTTAPSPNGASFRLPSCAAQGSCAGSSGAQTGRSQPVRVRGHYRRDGTYVRPHRRARPR